MMTAFDKLMAISEEIGLPKHFKEDLTVYDKRLLEDGNLTEFYWIARTSGTHLYTPEDLRKHIGLLKISDHDVRWYHCVGGEVSPVTVEEVRKKIWPTQ